MALGVLLAVVLAPVLLLRAGGGSPGSLQETRFTVAVSGDLIVHSPMWPVALESGEGAYDFEPMLAGVRPYIARADLALCHVETPLSDEPPAGYPLFSAPRELAEAVASTGFDGCDTASNHALDQHVDGLSDTLDALDGAGLRHTGTARSREEDERRLIFDVKGIRVALIAYTDATNGIPPPAPWAINLAEDPVDAANAILRDAEKARDEGADVVLVNAHWGEENSTTPSESQLELARRLTASDLVDAVVGQGPHVVQPIRRMDGKPVVFSEGNLLSNQSSLAGLPAETQHGLIALLRFRVGDGEVRVDRVDYVPTTVRLSDYVALPVGRALVEGSGDEAELRAAYVSTVGIAGRGQGIAPLPRRLP